MTVAPKRPAVRAAITPAVCIGAALVLGVAALTVLPWYRVLGDATFGDLHRGVGQPLP